MRRTSHLSLPSVSLGCYSVQNGFEDRGFVLRQVHQSGHGFREETFLPKKSIDRRFESRSFNADLKKEILNVWTSTEN